MAFFEKSKIFLALLISVILKWTYLFNVRYNFRFAVFRSGWEGNNRFAQIIVANSCASDKVHLSAETRQEARPDRVGHNLKQYNSNILVTLA